jgi:3-isopropylmalate/(R)-2-methylmalate dehydratase small subunit
LITCPEVVEAAQPGDLIEIDLERNVIRLNGREYPFPPLSPTALGIINDGGLVAHIRKKLGLTSTEAIVTGGGD